MSIVKELVKEDAQKPIQYHHVNVDFMKRHQRKVIYVVIKQKVDKTKKNNLLFYFGAY